MLLTDTENVLVSETEAKQQYQTMTEEIRESNWAEVLKEGITGGFAKWSTPLGVALFCGPVKSMTLDDAGKIDLEFEWVAKIASAHIGKKPWRKYHESAWRQEFNARYEPCHEGEDPEKGHFISFSNARIYTEYEGDVRKDEVEGFD